MGCHLSGAVTVWARLKTKKILEDLSWVLPFVTLCDFLYCWTTFGGRAFIFPIPNILDKIAQPSFSDSLIFPLPWKLSGRHLSSLNYISEYFPLRQLTNIHWLFALPSPSLPYLIFLPIKYNNIWFFFLTEV